MRPRRLRNGVWGVKETTALGFRLLGLTVLLLVCCCSHMVAGDHVEVKMGVLGLKPRKGQENKAMQKCDKVLYEQVALRLALDHIEKDDVSIMNSRSVVDMLSLEFTTNPLYVGENPREVIGNVTTWARENIVSCAKHEAIYGIETDTSVMMHDESESLPNTVDFLLGPRDAVSYECGMLKEIASLGRLPMVTWGCTSEELNVGLVGEGGSDNTTTISMLPENAENLQAHAILDFLRDHKWDQGHVAVVYNQDDSKSLQLIQKMQSITSCNGSTHGVRIHPYPLSLQGENSEGVDETLAQIKENGNYNIFLSTLQFLQLAPVIYKAYKLDMVGKDNIWIHTNDFTPTQLNAASTEPLSSLLEGEVDVEEVDADLRLGELLQGSFSIGWTPGGAGYTTTGDGSNPWEKFKKVWSEQTPDKYPDLGLPDEFFDYPPLSANAALVYDSAWTGVVAYLQKVIDQSSLYLDVDGDMVKCKPGTSCLLEEDVVSDTIVGLDDVIPNHVSHSVDGDGAHSQDHHHHHADGDLSNSSFATMQHLHVCAGYGIQGGMEFDGVSGPVFISKKTKARAPTAYIISAMNLQWVEDPNKSGSELRPFTFGRWPFSWSDKWTKLCSFPDYSLWDTRLQLTPLKYGTSEVAPEYRSSYTTNAQVQERNNQRSWIIIGVLLGTLGLLTILLVCLFYRYRTAHKKVIRNEKVAKDFQFEWETNAGKALSMLSNMIDNIGNNKDHSMGDKKQSFEKKLAEIRRFLLAQDARVEMRQVKSSIARVGAERYTPEVTAYLMEQALNASRRESLDGVYRKTNSFSRIEKSSIENVLQRSMTKGLNTSTSDESTETAVNAIEKLKRSFSLASTENLDILNPVVDSVVVEQVKKKLIVSLNLAATGDTSFDVFELARLTGDRPLSTLSLFLLHRRGVCSALRLNQEKLIAYAVEVENNMSDHPYHNRRHVADVVAGIYAFTVPGGCLYDFVQTSPLAMLAVVIAATVHDLQHPGVNNNFLCKTLHPLAIKHSDKSVNESHHLSCAFDLMSQDEFDFMGNSMDREDFITFRSLVIEMVLATDMKNHFFILERFKRLLKEKKEDEGSLDIQSEMSSVFSVAIKVADLIHCSRSLEVHHKWVNLITEEFLLQGDLEKEKNMQVSPGMDRSQPPGALQQVGFTEIFVLPLFKAWREYATMFGSQDGKKESQFYQGVESNYAYWLHSSKQKTTKVESV